MDKSQELPGRKTPNVEEPKPKESSAAPVIETPHPPGVIDPFTAPDIERKKPSTGKRKRINLKNYVKIDS